MSVEEVFDIQYEDPKEYTWEDLLASLDCNYIDEDTL